MTRTLRLIIAAAIVSLYSCTETEEICSIRINQVGFYPHQEKTLTLEDGNRSERITILNEDGVQVWEGEAVREAVSPWSGKKRRIFDFSQITAPGKYMVLAGKESHEFVISENAYDHLAAAALTAFYHQRSGMDLDTAITGKWARKGGHPDTLVYIHASAADSIRKEGSVISSPKGWYDAGDYNKYVVNSGYSMGLMAQAFLMFPEQYDWSKKEDTDYWDYIRKTVSIYKPLYNELDYNAEWLYTMQDPADGGVYHKLSTPSFEGFITPLECSKPRYVVQKSVTAALDFAGAMCSFAHIHGLSLSDHDINTRLYKIRYDKAEAAYAWAKANPDAFYFQHKINEAYDPDITTGAYGDHDASDEFFWAASELYCATHKKEYLEDVKAFMPEKFSLMSWGYVAPLGIFQWIQYEKRLLAEKHLWGDLPFRFGINEEEQKIIDRCKELLLEYCNKSLEEAEGSCYNSAYGNSAGNFHWGCCSSFCDHAICFLYAYEITGDRKYADNAFRNVNYVLGQNATGYCYVTGFGTKSPMYPHSRLCHSDGIVEPIPGLLVGGPNPGQQDIAEVKTYRSDFPDESYEDVMPSYASNEIAINWNASLVAVTAWLASIGNEM
ncbi:MAG: glycoside hydrolase family 9 protein [Bacteroidales bacterium]|nr:glycoside hydrolase family 9 protein [Bacteroidales bacterium]